MRLKNYTDFRNEKIREIIQFVRPNDISNFDVKINNSKNWDYCGHCYYNGASCHDTTNPFINVRVTENENYFPTYTTYKKGKGYINHLLLNREEAVVHVIAHEVRHLWQKEHKRGRVWGARGRYSNKDADAYAIRKTRQWRSRYNNCGLRDLDMRWLLAND